jgi:hypothetical protein
MMITLKSSFTELTLAETGFISSIKADGKEVLLKGEKSALVSLLTGGKINAPQSAGVKDDIITFGFEDGREVCLKYIESDVCVTFEAVEVPADADALMFGPVFVTLRRW